MSDEILDRVFPFHEEVTLDQMQTSATQPAPAPTPDSDDSEYWFDGWLGGTP